MAAETLTERYYPEVTPGLTPYTVTARDAMERAQKAAALRRFVPRIIEPETVADAADNVTGRNSLFIRGLGGRAVDAAANGTAEFGNSISAAVFTLFNDGQEAVEFASVRPIPTRAAQHAAEFALAAA